jgi:hypothetical protein
MLGVKEYVRNMLIPATTAASQIASPGTRKIGRFRFTAVTL